MATYDVSEIEYGSNNYPLVDSKSRAALTDMINNGPKNLINTKSITPATQTINGVEFSVDADGIISFTRRTTSSTASDFYLLPGGNNAYIEVDHPTVLSGFRSGSSTSYELRVQFKTASETSYTTYYQRDTPIEFPAGTFRYISIHVYPVFGKGYNDLTPMLCRKSYYNVTSLALPYKRSDRFLRMFDEGPKNLLNHDAPSFSKNNITWTNNGDGSWTISTSGASSQYFGYRIIGDPSRVGYEYGIPIPKGRYMLTGLPDGASSTTYRYLIGKSKNDTGHTRTTTSLYADSIISIDEDDMRLDMALYVATNVTIASPGVIVRPMLCRLEDYTDSSSFQPYRPPYDELWEEHEKLRQAVGSIFDAGAKNLLDMSTATGSSSPNGITWTVNSDGTVTANGTATATSYFYIWPSGTNRIIGYKTVLSGCPEFGSDYTFETQCGMTGGAMYHEFGAGILIPADYNFRYLCLCVRSGQTVTNLTFKPMLCSEEAWRCSRAYQPYRPSYQQLYDMVKALQNGS